MPYKIRDVNTGLYSTGTRYPRWRETGKIWATVGALKNHLNLFTDYPHTDMFSVSPGRAVPEHWEVVEVTLVEGLGIPAREFPRARSKVR